jgi:hypothetical protein
MHVVAHQTKSMEPMRTVLHPLLQEEIKPAHVLITGKNILPAVAPT